MSVVQALANVLEQTVSNPELCGAGVEIPRLYVKIQEIETPSGDFRLKLRRPLTLRVLKELEYWLVDDNKTLIWGTGDTIREAILDYMLEWQERLSWLKEHESELGVGLIKEYQKLQRLAA
ncbi:MAG: hypothetical protein NTZ05_03475 [Chloroflexi bacterium]|nr:hypothetical protein [Chloroflexota bacterium]